MSDIFCGPLKRPGGFEITERAIAVCGLPAGAEVADIGCGGGHTCRLLAEKYGFAVTGVDLSRECAAGPYRFVLADAERLPFDDSSLDGLIFECSMSKTSRPDAVLSECARVLRPGGRLMVSDLYARGEPAAFNGILGRVESRESILSRAASFGFETVHFEDCSGSLMSMWAQMVFETDTDRFYSELGAGAEELKRVKCGYFLAVFCKSSGNISRTDRWIGAVTRLGEKITPDGLRAWQLGKIKETLERAAATGFYGERLTGPGSVACFGDFEKLPFTTAPDVSADYTRFLTVSPSEVRRIVTRRSSGTSGDEKRVCFTSGDIMRTEEFFTYALSDYVRPGRSAAVFLSNGAADGIGDLLRRALGRIGVETVIHGSISDFDAAAAIAAGRSLLIGMPAEMLGLCRFFPSLAPQTVLLSADYIPDSVTKALRETWRCKVIRHFGMTETCFGCAVDCSPGGGQHIRHCDFYIEIVDPESGETLPPGRCGEIVITTLRSEAFPLIRYKTGDMGCLEDGVCECGGTLPRLGKVLGRLENLKTGLNIHALDELIFSFPGVLSYEAELCNALLTLTVDGAKIPADKVAEAFGVKVEVEYHKPERGGGKRKLLYSQRTSAVPSTFIR